MMRSNIAVQKSASLLYLWDKRTLYIGPLFEPLKLSQGAAALLVSLDKPISFNVEGESKSIECTSLLLPAGLSVSIDTKDAIIANCNLDPLGSDFSGLSALMQKQHNKIGYSLKHYQDFQEVYQNLQAQPLDSASAYELLDDLLDQRFHQFYPDHAIDSRVARVVEEIKKTASNNLSVDDLASLVNLSLPRLVQIFKKQTGVPIRRYRLWHRLYITAIEVANGGNLTEAAMSAGFTDSAHFSHTFKAMFGTAPTKILLQPNGLNIISPNQ
jgi:AraC-like DNA-binding protein